VVAREAVKAMEEIDAMEGSGIGWGSEGWDDR